MKGGWWNWKIEKDALEYWFAAGKLMIARRENFHRVYDLSERILPDWDDRRAPTLEESLDYLVLKSVRAIGVALSAWVADYFRLPKALVNRSLHRLVESGQIQPVEVRGWSETAWADPSRVENFLDLGLPSQRPSHTTVLSPFDSLVWDRARTRHVFKFDFTIECYLPAEKRKYGYFLLPVLHRGNLVGRADAKAHRKEGIFEVKSFYLEPTVKPTTTMAKAIIIALRQCAEWHNTPSLQISKCDPSGFLD